MVILSYDHCPFLKLAATWRPSWVAQTKTVSPTLCGATDRGSKAIMKSPTLSVTFPDLSKTA